MTPEKEPRPKELPGATQRIATGYGNLYVTVNFGEGGEPFEVFVNMGDSGGFSNSMVEALGKTISNALRSGTDAEEIAQDLTMIRSPKIDTDAGDYVYSIPDAVGIAMLRSIDGAYGEPVRGGAIDDGGPAAPEGEEAMYDGTDGDGSGGGAP